MVQVDPPLAPHPPDVPDELELAQLDGGTLRGRRVDERAVVGADLSGQPAHDLRLERVRLRDVDLSAVEARGLRLRDAVVREGAWSNIAAVESVLVRVEATGVRATGADFTEAELEDVVFESCRLDLALFRFATLGRVVFRDCRLDEADFHGAKLASVRFESSALPRASFDAATFSRCEIRDCDLTGLQGVERLGGVRMGWPEVVEIAGSLAAAQGIAVIEPDPPDRAA